MDACGCASHVYLHASAFIIRMWTKTFFCSCARNVNAQVCVSECESIQYKPQCVSDYSSSSSLCKLCVQLQTSLGKVAKGLSRQRWSDQKIPGSLKHTTWALLLLTARLACREQTSPYKYMDKKTFLRRVGAPTHSPHNQYVKM